MKDYYYELAEDKFYHIYNRGNNKERLFFKNENYEYFLRKFDEYLSDYLDVFAYSLLPNHFHFLVQVKSLQKDAIPSCSTDTIPLRDGICTTANVHKLISNQFRKFFITYSQAINVQENRTGSLLQKRFKRLEVDNTRYFSNLVFYIHANSQLHKITDDFRQYPWSSYSRILNGKPSKLKKKEVLDWFSDKENFVNYHGAKIDMEVIKDLMIE